MSLMKHPESRRFEGRVAIVTGAGRGIGLEYARSLASEGAKVVLAEIKIGDAEKSAAEINEEGGTALAIHTDVSNEESVKEMAARTNAEFGGIDHLVNNAALYGDREPWDALTGPLDYWNYSLAVNMTSVLLCTRSVVPFMENRGGGSIVNQSSGAALLASPQQIQYGVTKMGVITLTFSFAKLLGPRNIRVNAIAPGLTDTEAYRKQTGDAGGEPGLISQLAIARRGSPKEQAAGVLFLLSDDASYVTGQVLSVNGGLTMSA